jgi:hypothetical protein
MSWTRRRRPSSSRRPAPYKKEGGDELGRPFELDEKPFDLAAIEDGRESLGTLGRGEITEIQVFAPQHLLVEEDQCIECLVLGRGGNVAGHCQVVEEGDDLLITQVPGVTLAMKQDVALGPVQVGLLRADAVVLATYEVAHLAEQPGAADDAVRIDRPMGLTTGLVGRMHAQHLFLEDP